MATATAAATNDNNKSSGVGLNRLILSRPLHTPSIIVDHSESQRSSNISNGGSSSSSSSTNMKNSSSSSSNVGGAFSRTLHQIGKFFNSGLTSVTPTESTALAFTRARRESLNRDTLAAFNNAFSTTNETFSRRESFGRTYSFTRCASFSRTYSFHQEQPGN